MTNEEQAEELFNQIAISDQATEAIAKIAAALDAKDRAQALAVAEAWEDVARFGIEWMKNPGGVDARFISAVREKGKNMAAAAREAARGKA